jgi:2'-5' RNA ligase
MSSAGRVGGGDTLRLFLALRLPRRILDGLEEWGTAQLSRGRRVPREHLHVTLAFLGARPVQELPAIVDALRTAAAGSASIALEPVAYRETRSVGMVVLRDMSGAAARVADDLHGALERLGVYRRETRPWLPHVTVLRFRERPRLRPVLPALGSFAPSDAAAFLSRLHPTGARYEVLEAVPLGRPGRMDRAGRNGGDDAR